MLAGAVSMPVRVKVSPGILVPASPNSSLDTLG